MIRAVSLDLYVLRKYTRFVESFKKVLMRIGVFVERKQFDVELLDTFAHASFYELDYVHEAANQERFAQHLHTSNVYVPTVYHGWTTRRVLTTEWIEGKQLAKSSPETIRRLIPCGVECFLHQLLSIGFFHSDPHPGNLLVNDRGQLVLIDFGLCAEVGQPDTKGMTSAIVHLMQGDVAALVDDAIALRFLPEDVDKEMLLPSLQAVFDRAQLAEKEGGESQIVLQPRAFDFKTQERRAQFKHISRDLNKIFYDFPFVVPEYFALITRALIVLEGIAVTGDPNFDIFAAAYPFASSRAVELFGWNGVARIGAAAVVGSDFGASSKDLTNSQQI
jgi:aarF domain-containing kinase